MSFKTLSSSKECATRSKQEEPFLLRFIKVLTRKLKLNVVDTERLPWMFENDNLKKQERTLRYTATLRLSEKDVKMFQTLSNSPIPDISSSLYDLDHALSNLFISARPETTEEMEKALTIDYGAIIAYYLPSESDLTWIMVITSFTSVSFLLYTGRLNVWKFLGLLFFVSSIWHWTRMYKKALADKHITLSKSKDIPKECSPDSMSWSHFVLDSIFVRQGNLVKLRS